MTTVIPISVVVPTVSRPVELARCLDAILDGDVLPGEVLVIDQGGEEATASVVAARKTDGLSIIHITSGQRGLSAARNIGLRHVSMPWVAFTDDDCVPTKTWLATIHTRTSAADAPDGVGGRVLPFGEATPDTHAISLRVSNAPAVFRRRALPWAVGTGGNMTLKVAAARSVGGYDERLGAGSPGEAGEDLEIVHRLLRSGAVLAYDPAVVVRHGYVFTQRRLSTRRSYGFGMGAFAGMWLRCDRWVATILARWMLIRLVGVARAVKRRDPRRLREEALLVKGVVAGARYGWHLRSPVPFETEATAAGASAAGAVDAGRSAPGPRRSR